MIADIATQLIALNSTAKFGYMSLVQLPQSNLQKHLLEITRRLCPDFENFVAREIEICRKNGITIKTIMDDDYPPRFRNLANPPIVVYMRGNADLIGTASVAIVGTRKPDSYGQKCTSQLSGSFAELGIPVVSGLARGVDTIAHQACLSKGGKTIAVIGGGILNIYPPENESLARRIASNGLIISEHPVCSQAKPQNFPLRNRLISALSDAVIVVQAGLTSGALITAYNAIEQGKEVFAVPGKIDNPHSRGCHKLLKEGAALAEDPIDVIANTEALREKCSKLILNSGYVDQYVLACLRTSPMTIKELHTVTEIGEKVLASVVDRLVKSRRVICENGYIRLPAEGDE